MILVTAPSPLSSFPILVFRILCRESTACNVFFPLYSNREKYIYICALSHELCLSATMWAPMSKNQLFFPTKYGQSLRLLSREQIPLAKDMTPKCILRKCVNKFITINYKIVKVDFIIIIYITIILIYNF